RCSRRRWTNRRGQDHASARCPANRRSRRHFEVKSLARFTRLSVELEDERRALVRNVRTSVERISHARNWIVDKDRLQRLFTAAAEDAESFQRLLATRAAFAVAID